MDTNINDQAAPVETQSAPLGDIDRSQSLAGARPPAVPSLTPQSVPVPAPAESKHSWLGKAAQALFSGETTDYKYDDKGNLTETKTPMKPGSMFRHMLAGALLGGAIGSQSDKGFGGGFTTGAAGVQADAERKDAIRRKQAQEAYEMRLKGLQSGRDEEHLDIEKQKLGLEKREQEVKETLAKTQNMMWTAEVAKVTIETMGKSFGIHKEAKEFFEPMASAFAVGGLKPFQEVEESQITKFMADRPDKASLVPVITDVRIGVDANGAPSWQYVYGIYDTAGKNVTLSADTLKLWKKSNLPEAADLKVGSTVSAKTFVALQTRALPAFREKMAEETAIAGVAHLEAQTTELKARAEAYLSEKIKTNRELRKEENLQEAMKEYEKEGRDINNVKPELRSYLIDFARKEQDSQRALLSTLVTSAEKARESGDTESANRANTAAQETLGRIQALSRISDIFSNADVSKLPKPMPGEPTGLDSAAAFKAVGEYRKVYGNDPTFVAQKMLENGFTLPETTSAAPPPAATAPPFAQSLIANPAKKIAQKLSSMPAETMLQNVRD